MKHISRTLRQQTRQRARQRCEYCNLPEAFAFQTFQIDHILSHKHGGRDDLKNFAWACGACNNAKGSDVGSYDAETDAFVAFFNPRTQNWHDHFEINAGIIVGKTPTGALLFACCK